MISFFGTCKTLEAIKILYRKLAMQHHPDRGGDTATMVQINTQYQEALKDCDGSTSTGSDGKEHTYHYNAEAETEIMEKISTLCGMGMDEVEILLIGTWIWVSGDTKPYKATLKAMGCKWHGRRRCWYWHPAQKYRSRQNPGSLESIAAVYGCTAFDSDDDKDRRAIG